jgi:hypothetical protein
MFGPVAVVGMVVVGMVVPVVGRIGVDRMGPVDAAVIPMGIPQILPILTSAILIPLPSLDHPFDPFFGEAVLLGNTGEFVAFDVHLHLIFPIFLYETVGALFVAVGSGVQRPRRKEREDAQRKPFSHRQLLFFIFYHPIVNRSWFTPPFPGTSR